MLRIEHLLDKPVSGLSSGDRQRVALGRAIVRQPLAFMMDEPLGALDSEFRELMCQELRGLHDRLKATTVYVTHDQLEAMSMADTIAIMNQGVIEQLGAPQEVYERPASVFVADFIGSPSMNFLPFDGGYAAGARQVRLGEALVAVPALREDVSQRPLLCGVRPEHVRFGDDSAAARRGAGHRVPGHQPDRHAGHRAGRHPARQGRRRRAGAARRPGRAGVRRHAVSLFDQPAAARCARRATKRPADTRLALAAREPPMADLLLQGVGKRFGEVQAVARPEPRRRQRRVHRAARPQRRRQDHHAAPGGRAWRSPTPAACTSAAMT